MPDDDKGWADCSWADEAARVAHRRLALNLPEAQIARTRLALALSGGGLRGAAFCLGVMQALAEADCPASAPSAPSADPCTPTASPASRSLLARVDYLSTVGGGGYIGAFFTSLFIPGRLEPGTSPRQAAESAYLALRGDAATPAGRRTMTWLRESGRALTSTSVGKGLLAAVVLVRNWVAMQCILGSVLLVILALLALGLHLIIGAWPGVGRDEMALLYAARRAFNEHLPAIWWSEYLWLPIVSALLLALPPAIACWLVYPRPDPAGQPARVLTRAVLLASIAGALVLLETFKTAILIWLVVATCLVILLPTARAVAMYRVRAARALRGAAMMTAALAALGIADTIARSWYLYGSMAARPWSVAGPALAAAALAWLLHHGAAHRDPVPQAASPHLACPTWRRLPMPSLVSLLTGAAAATLGLLLVALWSWIVLWVRWDGGEPVDWLVFGKAWTTPSLLALVLAALAIAVAIGRGFGLLNLSSLQPFHAARLTRAYLGASNGQRFAAGDSATSMDSHDVARDDALALDAYYDPHALAPLHLVNVTLNETIDAAGQRIPRGRRGRPLCIGPGAALTSTHAAAAVSAGLCVRFTVDGKPCRAVPQLPDCTPDRPRTIGDWIAVSGGAAPIGPGSAVTFGASLLVGLANLRPGIWWQGRMATDVTGDPSLRGWLGTLFRTQCHLGRELAARFHGMRGDWQYLSDGGHFDNTAVYELLRPERLIGLIVLCDCGSDPGYRFADLANLIGRARADLGLEIEVDSAAAHDPVLGDVFGTPDDFAGDALAKAGDKAAILLNVHDAGQPDTLLARIIVIKPRLNAGAPDAVRQYGAQPPAFPQEGTTDAFFGEARWENHRTLGRALGRRIATGPVGARLFAKVP
ncbi:hypothetical protein [Cupriavidus pauculus]|uniref:PNPLA domain-containing protein n=1 Tax=Cupriavidus pauculus TaxID=82633 RepID=A0A2N5C4J4_9BURK|nr:hypothetical protein [Cupriavidus pauculus]PLP97141.1 hypothetical protein CYJ10_29140 [Cupriavidus pauculus]